MGERYGVEVSPSGNTTVRAQKDITLHTELATGKITNLVGSSITSSYDTATGTSGSKSHTGYAGSDFFTKTVAVTTLDATAVAIFTLAVPLSTTVGVWAQVVGKKVGASADGLVSFKYNGATNAAGTVAVVGTTGGSDLESASGAPAVTIVADDTADTIVVKVAGIAAETWAWVARIQYMQVTSSA